MKEANSFAMLWEEINGIGAWKENPWVAAISCSVHKHNIDALQIALGAAQ
jgi:hypothetical protein